MKMVHKIVYFVYICRGLKESTNNSYDNSNNPMSATTSQIHRKPNANAFKSSAPSSTTDAKLPKWFKAFGK